MRIDPLNGQYIGAGEDAVFTMLQELTGLEEMECRAFPNVGIYRQLPISHILDDEQLKYLAELHKKSSVDVFLIPYRDDYMPNLARIAVRVEGKKGTLKMIRQVVQKSLLSKWCQVVDILHYECPNIFKDNVNDKSRNELIQSFKTARVELPLKTNIA